MISTYLMIYALKLKKHKPVGCVRLKFILLRVLGNRANSERETLYWKIVFSVNDPKPIT